MELNIQDALIGLVSLLTSFEKGGIGEKEQRKRYTARQALICYLELMKNGITFFYLNLIKK